MTNAKPILERIRSGCSMHGLELSMQPPRHEGHEGTNEGTINAKMSRSNPCGAHRACATTWLVAGPMNQMGHGIPNLIAMDTTGFDKGVRPLLPGYMTMGETGMGGHAEHMQHMTVPRNSIPMKGDERPFGYIDMGGMFTVITVRDGIETFDDPGWYEHPVGTVAGQASDEELRALGLEPSARKS